MATVTFDKAQRWFPGAEKPTVPGIDLEIRDGECMVLDGPSGCGKATTLRRWAWREEGGAPTGCGVRPNGGLRAAGGQHRMAGLARFCDPVEHRRPARAGGLSIG